MKGNFLDVHLMVGSDSLPPPALLWHNGIKYVLKLHYRKKDNTRTVKSSSEARIFASTNPQYHSRLFIELQVQYMKIPSLNLGRTCCVQKLFLTFRTIFVHNMFSPCSAKRKASDKDLHVLCRQSPLNLHHIPLTGVLRYLFLQDLG